MIGGYDGCATSVADLRHSPGAGGAGGGPHQPNPNPNPITPHNLHSRPPPRPVLHPHPLTSSQPEAEGLRGLGGHPSETIIRGGIREMRGAQQIPSPVERERERPLPLLGMASRNGNQPPPPPSPEPLLESSPPEKRWDPGEDTKFGCVRGPSGSNLFVCVLPEWAMERDVLALAASHGRILDCRLIRHANGRSRNFAHLATASPRDALQVMRGLRRKVMSMDPTDARYNPTKPPKARTIQVDPRKAEMADMLAGLSLKEASEVALLVCCKGRAKQ
uniref:RRM domain-containing protein n=1 Tax=Chromera velia CCMP2878 TaxID=1169474 RepID=A0A0G4I853_9ALVE|eukprot:Cvel_11786.t1-p1 / transcript=Cvel_11786.t1 / gene=Cvel_11786 / organism=Chromera_velia_CCMP2878 / gene_product=hypothetical protein / transcript_product=hypothetical protein / location=Cvel_scaffold749:61666-62982(+) / protein_length=275 / sequence_SO=supercontig / SO=protein_coding / is_pseudo=false